MLRIVKPGVTFRQVLVVAARECRECQGVHCIVKPGVTFRQVLGVAARECIAVGGHYSMVPQYQRYREEFTNYVPIGMNSLDLLRSRRQKSEPTRSRDPYE